MENRYRRLARVSRIGEEAIRKLSERAAIVVGCGALGGVAASLLVRSGIGRVRLVDRDIVEEANLSDQLLYTEDDAASQRPKAEAAARHLKAQNRHVEVEGRVTDFSPENALILVEDMDIIIDGSDNLETKYLLNDVAVFAGKPWIYAGCAGTDGVVLAVLPGKTHCLRCLWPQPPPAPRIDGCESMGILPTTAPFIGAIQVTEALKILLGRLDQMIKGLIRVDVWTARFRRIPIPVFRTGPSECPACGARDFPYLSGRSTSRAMSLCGRQTVLIVPAKIAFDYAEARSRVMSRLEVQEGRDYFRFEAESHQFLIFSSGRALVHGTGDPAKARALYGRYLAF